MQCTVGKNNVLIRYYLRRKMDMMSLTLRLALQALDKKFTGSNLDMTQLEKELLSFGFLYLKQSNSVIAWYCYFHIIMVHS